MKKNIISLLALPAMLFCATAFTSCSDDDDAPPPPNPEAPGEEVYDDQMKEKLTLPTVVIGDDFDPVTRALLARMTDRETTFSDKTKAVVIDAVAIPSLTTSELASIKALFDRGGSVVLSEADPRTAYDFSMSLGEAPSFIPGGPADRNALHSHFCDIYVFNNHNDEFIAQDVEAEMKGKSFVTDQEGNVVSQKEEAYTLGQLTPYQHGLRADKLALWINNNSEPHETEVRGINDIASAQRICYDYSLAPTYDAAKVKDKSAAYSIIYMITGIYSFEHNADYYAVHQEIIGSNSSLNMGNWKQNGEYHYGFYLGYLRCDHSLMSLSDYKYARPTVQQTSPSTTQNARQESVSLGFSLTGEVGLAPGGPSASLSGGFSYSETYTMTIPDVSIKNQCKSGDDHSNAKWEYEVANPTYRTDMWGYIDSFNPAPAVSTNTINTHNTWLWVVNNPSGKYYMNWSNEFLFSERVGKNYVFHHQNWTSSSGSLIHGKMVFNEPNRKRK